MDASLHLTTFNMAFREDMRKVYGGEIALGQVMPPDWMPPGVQEDWNARYQRVLRGETFMEEVNLPLTTGGALVRQYIFRPVLGANQKVVGISCSGRDISL